MTERQIEPLDLSPLQLEKIRQGERVLLLDPALQLEPFSE